MDGTSAGGSDGGRGGEGGLAGGGVGGSTGKLVGDVAPEEMLPAGVPGRARRPVGGGSVLVWLGTPPAVGVDEPVGGLGGAGGGDGGSAGGAAGGVMVGVEGGGVGLDGGVGEVVGLFVTPPVRVMRDGNCAAAGVLEATTRLRPNSDNGNRVPRR